MSGCCPFPREPAQTRVHIHTHGQVQAATPSVRLSTLPPAPQAPWLPSSQFSRSLPPQEPPSPAPVLVPSPIWLQRSLPREAWQGGGQLWGASHRGGPVEARAPAPVPGQAGLALRTPGPPSWLFYRIVDPPECFWERSVSKHKERSSCVLRKSHVLFSDVLVSTSVICPSVHPFVYLLRPILGETRWEKGGGKSKKEGGKEKETGRGEREISSWRCPPAWVRPSAVSAGKKAPEWPRRHDRENEGTLTEHEPGDPPSRCPGCGSFLVRLGRCARMPRRVASSGLSQQRGWALPGGRDRGPAPLGSLQPVSPFKSPRPTCFSRTSTSGLHSCSPLRQEASAPRVGILLKPCSEFYSKTEAGRQLPSVSG